MISLTDGDGSWQFTALCCRQLRPSTVDHKISTLTLDDQGQSSEGPWLLFTERANGTVAEKLRGRSVNYMDAAGNAWLQQPGLFIRIEGQKPVVISSAAPRTPASHAALPLTFLLLKGGSWLSKPYRELADSTGLALSTVAGIMASLTKATDVIRTDAGLKLRSPADLLSNWEQHWPGKLGASFPGQPMGARPMPDSPDYWPSAHANRPGSSEGNWPRPTWPETSSRFPRASMSPPEMCASCESD